MYALESYCPHIPSEKLFKVLPQQKKKIIKKEGNIESQCWQYSNDKSHDNIHATKITCSYYNTVIGMIKKLDKLVIQGRRYIFSDYMKIKITLEKCKRESQLKYKAI